MTKYYYVQYVDCKNNHELKEIFCDTKQNAVKTYLDLLCDRTNDIASLSVLCEKNYKHEPSTYNEITFEINKFLED